MSRIIERYKNGNNKVCIVVSNRPWNKSMANALSLRTEYDFQLISDPKELTISNLDLINPRFIFFPHWSHHIDSNIYEKYECVIFHMTDLPYGRGGSPLQNLIAQGINETQISAIRCVEEMDAGPIYLKKTLSLYGAAEEIFLRASNVIENMVVDILHDMPKPIPQEGTSLVFKRRTPEESDLGNIETLEQAFDLIRMLDADGYPNAFLKFGPFKLEFSRAALKSDQIMADVRISLIDKSILKR